MIKVIIQWKMILVSAIVLSGLATSLIASNNKDDSISVSFESGGSKVVGWFFAANDTEPHPTVILLHGFPGGEGDLFGLGKRLKEDGINAFTFSFRGSWKSEGIFLPGNSLKDVEISIDFLKSPDILKKYNIDTTRIVLLGYSAGSSMAILGSLTFPSVEKVISIGTTDFSVLASKIENNEGYRKAHQAVLDEVMSDSTVIRSIGGKATHEYLIAHKDDYNLVKHSKELSNKQILLIGGWKDDLVAVEDHTIPFYRALQKNNAKNIKIQIYDTDHFFVNVREQLYRDILDWIRK